MPPRQPLGPPSSQSLWPPGHPCVWPRPEPGSVELGAVGRPGTWTQELRGVRVCHTDVRRGRKPGGDPDCPPALPIPGPWRQAPLGCPGPWDAPKATCCRRHPGAPCQHRCSEHRPQRRAGAPASQGCIRAHRGLTCPGSVLLPFKSLLWVTCCRRPVVPGALLCSVPSCPTWSSSLRRWGFLWLSDRYALLSSVLDRGT